MGNPMRSTDFRAVVEPILNEEFNGIYDQRADEWKQCFKEETGTPRNYHEEVVLYGFGAAPELPDGMPVTYQSGGVLFVKRYVYAVYGLAFALTKVLIEDGDHIRVGQTYSRHLAQSMVETKETLCANVFNRAFNGAYVGGDNQPLCSSTHPIIGGSFSNLLTVAAALSQTSLEALLIQLRNAVDNNGKRIRLQGQQIVTGPSNVLQAEVLIKTPLRTGGAFAANDINPVRSMGLLPKGQANLSRITSTTSWFIQTDAPEGLKLMKRRGLEKSMEGDFETDSMKYKSTERYREGWTDPRCLYGTPGV